MHLSSQRGSGALIAVITILLMGTLMLNTMRHQLEDSMSLVADERNYFQQITRAISALAWGQRQRWVAAEAWHCQHEVDYHWRACLQPEQRLLRADSGPGTLALWHWVSLRSNGSLQAQPHGWLDYCPLADEAACYVE